MGSLGLKPIRGWRVVGPESGPGLFVWFDPDTELLTLRDLTEDEKLANLDSVVSVSALVEGEAGTASTDGCEGSRERTSFTQLKFNLEEVRDEQA